MSEGETDSAVEARFGPGRVWLAVMLLDLALSCTVAYTAASAALSPDEGEDPQTAGPGTSPFGSLTWLTLLLAVSVAGTWCAVLRRGTHPRSVRAAFAVTLIRLILLAFVVGAPYALSAGCDC